MDEVLVFGGGELGEGLVVESNGMNVRLGEMNDEFDVDLDHLGVMVVSESFEERVLQRNIVLGNRETKGVNSK